MKKFDVCIFDLDGTLINSLADLGDCTNEALQLHSLPTHPLKNYKQYVGNGVKNLIKTAMGEAANYDKLFASVYKAFCILYDEKCLEKTTPYIGICEMIKELKEKDVKLCILSNKTDNFVERIVSALFDKSDFDLIWGKKSEYPVKPAPDSLLAILKTLDCSTDRCLYVGDSNVDVATAKNAGVEFCGVEWGFRGIQELHSAGAKTIAKKPCDIVKMVVSDE